MREPTEDFRALGALKLPIKRAAYSDRTAWLMSLLAELAYLPFEAESDQRLLDVASELARMDGDEAAIERRLRVLRQDIQSFAGADNNSQLVTALAAGEFNLAAVLFDAATGTEGYVASKADGTLTAIVFRGTQQVKDWMTNVDLAAIAVEHPETGQQLGNMHRGFHEAYRSVAAQIEKALRGIEDQPLYIAGHSLGGALAVVATWYQRSDRLAACYTFGAPRVGDQDLIHRFKTPIYRVVNGPDPVPFVPPTGFAIDVTKGVVRVIGALLPFAGVTDWITERLIRVQAFRHYGYMRYLTVAEAGTAGDFPDLRVEFSLSTARRLIRFVQLQANDSAKRIDQYHDIGLYRRKLRAHAIRHNS